MARRGAVLEFRRSRGRKRPVPGPVRTGKLNFHRRSKRGIGTLLGVLAVVSGILFCILLAGERWFQNANAASISATSPNTPLELYWVGGDSGTIDGRPLRLRGADAPEGSPSRARCNTEQLRADETRSEVRTLTGSGAVEIRKSHCIDKYGREVLSLSVNGSDLASSLIASGYMKRWNYDAGDTKPGWGGA